MSYNPYQQTPANPVPGRSNKSMALDRVKTPAILLIVSGVIGILTGVFGGGSMAGVYLGLQDEIMQELRDEPQDPEITPEMMQMTMNAMGWAGVAIAVLGLITGVVSIIGGVKMMKLEGRGIALFAAAVSLVPCAQGCILFSLPVGIYAIVVLCDSQVKQAFD